ncbi:MAG: universal stress protein [Acidobacteriota bacterium]|nr:universal stress protein [Acidobacteriota bacterium]
MAEYKKIFVSTDFSDRSVVGVQEAAKLAKALDAEVVLVYIVQDTLPPMMLGAGLEWPETIENHRQKAEEALVECANDHLAGVRTHTVARVGAPADTLLAAAEELEADIIVMASHGYGLMGQIVLGSTTERVLKRANIPVLVVRSPD